MMSAYRSRVLADVVCYLIRNSNSVAVWNTHLEPVMGKQAEQQQIGTREEFRQHESSAWSIASESRSVPGILSSDLHAAANYSCG